jgi:hypothetical protein
MLKSVAVGAAALAIVGSSIVYAQQRSGGPDGVGSGGFGSGLRLVAHYRPSIDDMKAFTDARIAALKAGLQLTPDQEKNWPPFEQALRGLAKLRIDHLQARLAREELARQELAREEAGAPQTPPAPFERLAKRADALAKRSAALKQLADTGAPLYQSLSDAQKERFKILAHQLRPHHHHFAWRGGEGGWRDGRGEGHESGHEGGHEGGWRGRWFGHGERGPDGPQHRLLGREDEGSEL